MFNKSWLKEAKELYPNWKDLHDAIRTGSPIIGRYLDDSTSTSIHYQEILNAASLEELKEKARLIKRKLDFYNAYREGTCYTNEDTRREKMMCPRLYAQSCNDRTALEAFQCYGVFYIPDCAKKKCHECWRRFDELGLKLKEVVM